MNQTFRLNIFTVCLCAAAVFFLPAKLTAQSGSYDSEMAEMLFSMVLTDENNVVIIGIDDPEKLAVVKEQVLNGLKSADSEALFKTFSDHSLTVDISETTESTLTLRSLGVLEERLLKAIHNRDTDTVNSLLQNEDVDVNKSVKVDPFFTATTPLIIATGMGDIQTVNRLLDKGATVNSEPGEPSALHGAVAIKRTDLVEVLLAAGATIDPSRGLALLAAKSDDVRLMTLLVEQGADASVVGDGGWTTLSEAIRSGNLDVAKYVVDLSDPRISNYPHVLDESFPKSNALHLARHHFKPEDGQELIENILERTRSLGGDQAVSHLQLQAHHSAAKVAYAALDVRKAVNESVQGLNYVDVPSLSAESDAVLVNDVFVQLTELHEFSVIAGEPLSDDFRRKINHMASIDNGSMKWHDMLDIVDAAKESDVTSMIEQWQSEHGGLKARGWSYTLLLNWADEIQDKEGQRRVFGVIDQFRPSIFK